MNLEIGSEWELLNQKVKILFADKETVLYESDTGSRSSCSRKAFEDAVKTEKHKFEVWVCLYKDGRSILVDSTFEARMAEQSGAIVEYFEWNGVA